MFSKSSCYAALLACALPVTGRTDTARDAFVASNILAIFYHEFGHAVIDVMEVPIFGQEEDAADVISVLLIDWLFEEETAQAIAYDSALGFLEDPEEGETVAWWDLHGPDEQRFYNHVCLFYGGNPDAREDLAEDLGLPEERAETCAEEYDLAAESWGMVFDQMDEDDQSVPMVFVAGPGAADDLVNEVLGEEVANMSEVVSLPETIEVRVEFCDEANAFYDPAERSIVFCSEFVDHLGEIYDRTFN